MQHPPPPTSSSIPRCNATVRFVIVWFAIVRFAIVWGGVVLICLFGMVRTGRADENVGDGEERVLPITDIAAIRRLTNDEVVERLPVQIRGQVIYQDANQKALVVMDQTAIYCSPRDNARFERSRRLIPGDVVQLDGVTAIGHGAPVVEFDALRWVKHAAMPSPREVTFVELQDSPLDSQLVTISGVVHAADYDPHVDWPTDRPRPLRLIVSVPGGSVLYHNTDAPGWDVNGLVDAEVRITGMCGPSFNNRSHFLKNSIRSFDPASLEVLQPASKDPFDVPSTTIENVMPFHTQIEAVHRKRFQATVTAVTSDESGRHLFVVDGIRGMRLDTFQNDTVAVGDVIEASGFVQLEAHYPVMSEAIYRVVGREPSPLPVEVTRDEILAVHNGGRGVVIQDYDARLVKLTGRLASVEDHRGSPFRLFVDCDGAIVTATLSSDRDPGSLRELRQNSELAITGICQVSFFPSDKMIGGALPSEMRLLLRRPDDVVVVSAASWWTASRLAAALTWSVICLLAALGTIETLRRRVAQRSIELAESNRLRRELQIGSEATLRERERLAADLHDSLEQTLTGVALQIHATRTAPTEAKSQRNLFLAEQMLNQSRVDLRRSVWNLRPTALEGHQLRAALSNIAATIGEATRTRFRVDGCGDEPTLSNVLTQNLLLLAKESVTNAIKHASPDTIVITVDYAGKEVTLTVRDDGCGFDVQAAPDSHAGHFGLSGMGERAERIGATLTIQSHPDHGTTIMVKARDDANDRE